MKKIKHVWLLVLVAGLTACNVNNSLDEIAATPQTVVPLSAGTADFSKYVAVGASFTAGVSDGTVFLASQSSSFPHIMSTMMANAGGGAFTQPLVSDNIGGLLLGGTQISNPRLFFNGSGPAVLTGVSTTEVSNILTGPFNNMGVPGAKSFHLVAPGYGGLANVPLGAANPYYARMASSPTATVLADAIAQNPTFFTVSEIGGNDVLSYATTGGIGVVQTSVDPTTYGPNDITAPALFNTVFTNVINTLTAGGAKGVVLTIPSIVNLPFFTTVPYNAIPLDATTATQVNAGYATYNSGLQLAVANGWITAAEMAKRTISFAAGQNAVVIIDEDLTDLTGFGIPSYRQTTASDFLVLTSSSFLGTTVGGNPLLINGVTVPLADNWVLTPEEQNNIQIAINAYNTVITSVGNAKGLAVVDLNQLLTDAAGSGTQFDEYTMTANLVFGGLISLDGIHLTSRGYALMANKILEAIDTTYGSNFKASGNIAKVSNYPTNYPPGI